MRNRVFAFCLFALAIGIGEVASGTTVLTFNEVSIPNGNGFVRYSSTSPYTDQDFQLKPSTSYATVFGPNYPNYKFSGDSTNWMGFTTGTSVTLSSTLANTTFQFNSLDIGGATYSNTEHSVNVTFTGYVSGGSTLTDTVDDLAGSNLVTLNWANLTSLKISMTGGTVGIDNLTLNDPPTVPEPSSFVLATFGVLVGSVVVKFGRRNRIAA